MAVTLSIAMLGVSGRMGRSIIPLVAGDSSGLRLSGALVARGDHSIGQDAGSFAGSAPIAIAITDDPRRALDGASVAIDFTVAAASIRNAALCRELGVPMVIGTTGHNGAQLAELEQVARGLPVVLAPNMSLGVNVLFKLAELAARALKAEQYDAEIFEAHHRNKVDAPSGTALGLGRAAGRGRGVELDSVRRAPASCPATATATAWWTRTATTTSTATATSPRCAGATRTGGGSLPRWTRGS